MGILTLRVYRYKEQKSPQYEVSIRTQDITSVRIQELRAEDYEQGEGWCVVIYDRQTSWTVYAKWADVATILSAFKNNTEGEVVVKAFSQHQALIEPIADERDVFGDGEA